MRSVRAQDQPRLIDRVATIPVGRCRSRVPCRRRAAAAVLGLALLGAFLQSAAFDTDEDIVTARSSFREVVLTGFTRARAALPLVAESSGKITRVNAEIGEPIGGDGLFAQIDDTFIALDLESNRVKRAQLRSMLDYAQRAAERYRALASKGNASQQRLDELEQAFVDYGHQLDELEVRERVLEEKLSRTRVTAKPGWLVTHRRVEPGQRVNEGDVLGEVSDFTTLLVPFSLDPGQLAALETMRGALTIHLSDLDREVKASVYRINPGFDAATRKTALDLAIDTQLPHRRGGLRVELRLRLPEASGAVMLPPAAVEESYEEYWVTRENGERLRVVRLGDHSDAEGIWVRLAGPDISTGDRFRLNAAR